MTRILIFSPSAVIRAGLETIVERLPELAQVATTSDREELIDLLRQSRPDVLLAESDEALGAELWPVIASAPALVLLLDPTAAQRGPVSPRPGLALLAPDASEDEIAAAVVAVASGLYVADSAHTERSRPIRSVAKGEQPEFIEDLTPRELEVLGMLADGLANKMIARQLGISDHTVKFHVASIMAKLDAASRTEAVTIGMRRGLITI